MPRPSGSVYLNAGGSIRVSAVGDLSEIDIHAPAVIGGLQVAA
jgi:hypothetical protein